MLTSFGTQIAISANGLRLDQSYWVGVIYRFQQASFFGRLPRELDGVIRFDCSMGFGCL
jgi:hypothetical protein